MTSLQAVWKGLMSSGSALPPSPVIPPRFGWKPARQWVGLGHLLTKRMPAEEGGFSICFFNVICVLLNSVIFATGVRKRQKVDGACGAIRKCKSCPESIYKPPVNFTMSAKPKTTTSKPAKAAAAVAPEPRLRVRQILDSLSTTEKATLKKLLPKGTVTDKTIKELDRD